MGELTGQLYRILADYEARGRQPQMVLAVIAGLTHEIEEECGALPACLEQIQAVVTGWQEGRRPDLDALENIAGLVKQDCESGRQEFLHQ